MPSTVYTLQSKPLSLRYAHATYVSRVALDCNNTQSQEGDPASATWCSAGDVGPV